MSHTVMKKFWTGMTTTWNGRPHVGSDIRGIGQGRAALAQGDLAALAADPAHKVEAIRALQAQVPRLSLIDALRLVNEAQATAAV